VDGPTTDSRRRVIGRRTIVSAVVMVQLLLVIRGYTSDHKELAFQMFPESSTWRADIVRVTGDGERLPVTERWAGYRWDELVTTRGMQHPGVRHHADAGIDNQLAFLRAALDWVATHTPRDTETRYLEAVVTYQRNNDAPRVLVMRTPDREASR
jgi:hypothetical protein